MKAQSYINPRPFFYSFLALLFSISVTRYIFNLSIPHISLLVCVLVALTAILIVFKKFFILFLMITVMLFGGCWYFVGVNLFEGESFEGEVTVVGRLSDDVDYEEGETTYLLKDVSVNGKSVKNIELFVQGEGRNLNVGDVISFNGVLEKTDLFNLNYFNLTYYRNKIGYTAEVDISNVTTLSNEIKLVERFRLRVKDLLVENMGVDNGATAYAVLFGYTNDISSDTYSAYQDAGILHLLAVSGLNVTFLISLLGFILKLFKVNKWTNFLVCFGVLIIYAYLCSFAPSILRAGIMGIIFLACQLSGKCYDSLNTLGVAGLLALVTSPLYAFDVGFLMSYFCVIGIILLSPFLTAFFKKIFPKFVAESLAVSTSATIAILPFLALMYSKLNLLTFFTNLLTVPIFGVAYPFLCVAVVICLIMPFMGWTLTVCGFLFTLVNLIAGFFAQTPLTVQLTPFNAMLSALIFLILFSLSQFFMVSARGRVISYVSLSAVLLVVSTIFALVPMCSAGMLFMQRIRDEGTYAILTNSQHETIILDGSWSYTDLSRSLEYVSAYAVLGNVQVNNVLTEEAQNFLNISNFSHEGATNREGTTIFEYNKTYYLGNFSLRYLSFNNSFAGLEVGFDDILLLRVSDKISDEAKEYLSSVPYDVVFTNGADFSNSSAVLVNKGVSEYSLDENKSIYLSVRDSEVNLRRLHA